MPCMLCLPVPREPYLGRTSSVFVDKPRGHAEPRSGQLKETVER